MCVLSSAHTKKSLETYRMHLVTLIIQSNTIHSFARSNGSKYCYVSLTIQLNICHLFTHSQMVKQFYF